MEMKNEVAAQRQSAILNSPFLGIVGFLLHHLENTLACHGTVLRVAVNRDGLFKRSDVVFSMHVDACTALLRNLSYRAALTADDCTDHVAGDEDAQWKVSLTSWTTRDVSVL